MIDSINHNARSEGRGINPLLPRDEALLRLAGLLHDIGHGFLSHVSERAMSRISALPHSGSAEDARAEARVYFSTRKLPAFAELLASLIILLPEFTEILELANIPTWPDAENLADHIAHLIVGGNLNSSRPFLGEIISGAVDADKLDYMTRDCVLAGLPMPVDVERLLQKLQTVAISTSSEQGRPWAEFAGLPPNQSIYMMAMDERGGIAAEELVVSRVLLYDKLYHHQKIRAFEGLAEAALDVLIDCVPTFQSPVTYLELSDADFLEAKWPTQGCTDKDKLALAKDLVRRISDRHDIARAIAFGPNLIDSATPVMVWRRLLPFVTRERNANTTKFRSLITERAKQYLIAAGKASLSDSLIEELIIVDLPDPQGITEKTRFLVGNESTGVRLYAEVARVDRWAEAYEADKSIGYVYCPPEHVYAVHLAARSVIKDLSGVEMEDRQLTLTKMDANRLNEFAEIVRGQNIDVPAVHVSAGLKQDTPMVLAHDVEKTYQSDIEFLGEQFRSYEPFDGPRIDAAYIVNWLVQFPRDDIPLVIRVLRNVQFWTRQRVADGFKVFFEDCTCTSMQLLALGGPTTSAGHLQYLMHDLRDLTIDLKILGSPGEIDPAVPLVLFDDFIGSGGQSRTAVMQWYDAPPNEWIVHERHFEPLSPDVRAKIEASNITCLFVAGRRPGLRALRDTMKEYTGLDVAGYIAEPRDYDCFRLVSNIFERSADASRARDIFFDAGMKALADEDWTPEKKRGRALGYGNKADLNVFYYNTPSSTLSALWSGTVQAADPWMPLFKRRRRPAIV
jgi:hypothetical protein